MSKPWAKNSAAAIFAFASFFLQSSGLEKGSALHQNQRKPMPPQMVDYTKYDDVIELDCEEKPGYFNFGGAQLKPVVRVRMTCKCDTRHNQFAPETKYQDMWFKDGTAIGAKAFTAFPPKDLHEIAVFMKNGAESLNDAEIAACAGALIRLRLESFVNRNKLVTVRIPNAIFDRLKVELEKQNFVSYRENSLSIRTLIPIPLETDLGKRETMCFLSPAER